MRLAALTVLVAAVGCGPGPAQRPPPPPPSCTSEESACDGGCFDLARDPRNCGACANACDRGEECVDGACACAFGNCEQPAWPPPLDRTVATSMADATRFLYSGPGATQTGVAPGAIDELRVAVLRGRVLDLAGAPVAGVDVRALAHEELGRTTTDDDGHYDFVLNGGGPVVLEFVAAGFPLVSRRVEASWQSWVVVPDVALTPLDGTATVIDPSSPAALVARASTSIDPQGARTPTLVFKEGTTAVMTLSPAATAPLPAPWTVRATEYTVGAGGRAAMPGTLPPTSGYTFAAELSIDEAIAAGAVGVHFSQPVSVYVENFLGMRVGAVVPSGSLDRSTGTWVPEPDGRVLAVVSKDGGVAALDVDGDGAADDDEALAALGIDAGERAQLAELYDVGQELWRVPALHFSAGDYNSPYGPPPGAAPPPPPGFHPIKHACDTKGSIVACEDQVLKEAEAVKGTPFQLRYSSERVPGRAAGSDLDVRVTGAVVPPGVKGIAVQAVIAGRLFSQYYDNGGSADPIVPNITWSIPWDGVDAWSRPVQGTQPILIRTNYVYPAVRYETNQQAYRAFGGYADPGSPFPVLDGCVTISINGQSSNPYASPYCGFNFTRDERRGVGVWDAREAGGLGGWTLDVHHSYDPNDHTVRKGDGTSERADASASTVRRAVGGGSTEWPAAEGGKAVAADVDQLEDVAAAPDGTLYVVSRTVNTPGGLRRVERDGTIWAVAPLADLAVPTGLAVDENERVYVCGRDAQSNGRVVRVDEDGTETPVAGGAWQGGPTPNAATLGDGADAVDATLLWPTDVAIGPDGALYVADSGLPGSPQLGRVRRVDLASGVIDTVAGGGTDAGADEDVGAGESALAHSLYGVSAIAFDAQGRMLLALSAANTVARVDIDGNLTRFAGTGVSGSANAGFPPLESPLSMPNDLAAGPDGTVYIRTRHTGPSASSLVLAIRDGRTQVVAGSASIVPGASNIDGAPATRASFPGDHGLALAPDGALYVRTRFVLYRVAPRFAGFGAGEQMITSPDGGEIWVFDGQGRHLRTADALSGVTLLRFGYDGSGHLARVVDRDGRATTVERGGDGRPTAITAPGGERTELTLDAEGWLTTLRDPAGAETQLAYGAGGLLTSLVDRRGGVHTFTYDGDGRLTSDAGPAGHELTLERVEAEDELTVTVTDGAGRADVFRTHLLQNGDLEQTLTNAAGAVSSYRRQSDGTEVTTRFDGEQVTTRFGADPRYGVEALQVAEQETKSPAGRTSLLKIDRSATLSDAADPFSFAQLVDTFTVDGHATRMSYTKSSRTTDITTAGGRRFTLVEDAAGHELSFVEGSGRTPATRTFDALGRVTSVARGADAGTIAYDARSRPTLVTDASGRSVELAWDEADRMIAMTDGAGGAHGTAYDFAGDVIGFSEPSGLQHAKDRDGAGDVVGYEPPGGGAPWTFTRGDDGLVSAVDFGAGRALTVTRDDGGRRTSLAGAGEALVYGYGDATSRADDLFVDRAGTAFDQELAFAFDGGAPTQIAFTGAAEGVFTLVYDARGNVVSRRLQSGGDAGAGDDVTTLFAYDADDLCTKDGPFTFTRGGALGETTVATDATARFDTEYDALGRVASRTSTVAGVVVDDERLVYDAADRVTRRTEVIGGVSAQRDYVYDDAGRLASVKLNGAAAESSTYDEDGNRVARTRPGVSGAEAMSYDAQGRLTQRGVVAYVFDGGGVLAARGADAFTFGALRRLERADVGGAAGGGGITITYAFDGLGRRTARTVAGAGEQLLYGDPLEPWRITASRAPDGALTLYRYDPDGRLLALERGGASPATFYVATDVAGSPRVVTDAAGAVVKRIEYDAFGDVVSDSAPSFALAVGYRGGLLDAATGLVAFGEREYDPAAGRFTSRDPVLDAGGQTNLYAYAGDDPVNRADPNGLGARWDRFKSLFSRTKHVVDEVDEGARSIQLIADTNKDDRPITAFDCFLKYLQKLPIAGDWFGVPRDGLQVAQDTAHAAFAPGSNFSRAAAARDSGD